METEVQFEAHPDCQDCPLYKSAKSPGMATIPLSIGGHRRAILLVAKGPGVYEDAQGKPFAGPSGVYVRDLYLGWSGIGEMADCYGTNAVRCLLPQSLPPACVGACKAHLLADIRRLAEHYDEVILWLCGAEACRSILGKGLGQAFLDQGSRLTLGGMGGDIGWGTTVRTFITYNPAILYPQRKALKARPIRTHLLYLKAYLEHGATLAKVQAEPIQPPLPSSVRPRPDNGIISLDIETYGAVGNLPPQTTFQAALAESLDGVARDDLVVTAAMAWRQDGELRHAFWLLAELAGREDFLRMLLGLSRRSVTLLGMNVLFDLSWLRLWEPRLQALLVPENFRLEDLAVANFLLDEECPEKSLKTITKVLGVADYTGELDLKKERYESPEDPRLWSYNVLDATATLVANEVLSEHVLAEYGPSKLRTIDWYSNVLWTILDMHEAGIPYDIGKLEGLRESLALDLKILEKRLANYNVIARGEGSPASIQEMVVAYSKRCGLSVPLTPGRGQPKVTKATLNRLLETMELRGDPGVACLQALLEFKKLDKRLSAYVRPLLEDRPKKRRQLVMGQSGLGFAHPSWYYVPTQQEDEETGGTKQARLSSSKPGSQTQPPVIRETIVSRWGTEGCLLKADGSQLEYRCVAWLSKDPEMTRVFVEGADLHEETGRMIAEVLHIPYSDEVRQCGKHGNFLTVFRGGAPRFQSLVLRVLGKTISLDTVEEIRRRPYERFRELEPWQERLIREAVSSGQVSLEVGETVHFTRSILGGEETVSANIPIIVNFPVQALAACLTLDAQVWVGQQFREKGLRARLINNRHDEGLYDVPRNELEVVRPILQVGYEHPPLAKELAEQQNCVVPLKVNLTLVGDTDDSEGSGQGPGKLA